MEKVSVVIPVFDRLKCKRCVEHIEHQTYPYIELIKVSGNGVVSSKRNFGFRKCSGSMVMFLDEDEYLSPNTIGSCVRKIREGFDVVAVFAVKAIPHGYWQNCVSITRGTGAKANFFRRTVLENVGLYDESLVFCDDSDLYLRVLKAGFRIGVLDINDGYALHDETNRFESELIKTLMSRKQYDKVFEKYALRAELSTSKMVQRKRIFGELKRKPQYIFGVLLEMLILFVSRRL